MIDPPMVADQLHLEFWDDLEAVLVVKKLEDSWFEWDVVEIVGRLLPPEKNYATAKPEEWTQPEYLLMGGKNRNYTTDDISQAERMISGVIRWDGCSHFYFGPNTSGYIHLC
jgi:hypothetical protein